MADITNILDTLPDVSFIENLTLEDVQTQFINDFQAKYKELTGEELSLGLADPNRIILYACALQHYQALQYIDKAGKMGLLKYSADDFLDMLGALKGITRNDEKAATTTLRFTLSEVRNSTISITQGTQATNGELFFETEEYAEILPGSISVEVDAKCITKGVSGNGILAGEINTLTKTLPYIAKVENINTTSGGSDIEENEKFAERIFLAPAGYSTAGPQDAYEYWVKTFNSNITDVKVTSPTEGIVDIRFILNNGDIPQEADIVAIEELFESSNVRPLTDRLQISAPEIENYTLDLEYYINKSDSKRAATIQDKVNSAIEEYINWQQNKIGRDINPSQLINLLIKAGAKRVEVKSPSFTDISDTAIAKCQSRNIVYGGLEDD